MKFWQKSFFITVLLFLSALDALGFILLENSFALNEELALNTAMAEHLIIAESVHARVTQLSAYYTKLNPNNLKGSFGPYADYYMGQGVYLALRQNGEEVYNNAPLVLPEVFMDETAQLYETPRGLYCVASAALPPPHDDLRLVYVKDATALRDFKKNMLNRFLIIGTVISLLFSCLLLTLLIRLTRPFRRLNAAAAAIARGDYTGRAPKTGNDEIGEFAENFNIMAEQIENHIETLSQMNENRERFINDLAHEIRTPITAISGYAEILKIGNINESERGNSIDCIISQSKRIKDMAVKLSDLAFMTHGNIEFKSVDISAVISQAASALKNAADNKGIILNINADHESVMGETDLLIILLQNLIENAVKYSLEGGTVDIKAYTEDGGVVISVTDRGAGMDESEVSKITQPFYRVDKSRSRGGYGGVGLGLSLAERISDLHGARMEIKSSPGEGTRVKVCF